MQRLAQDCGLPPDFEYTILAIEPMHEGDCHACGETCFPEMLRIGCSVILLGVCWLPFALDAVCQML